MYRRILVGVDGSTASLGALQEAIDLARDGRAELRIIHVVESPYTYPDVLYGQGSVDLEALRQTWRHAGQRVLDQAVGRARQAPIEVESALLEDGARRLSAVIADEAKEWRADLIVVGTHGRRGLERLLLGSVAEGVARTAPVSVLLVRGH